MEKLDLKKIWEIMNKLSYEESKLSEENVFVSLLGNRSEYSSMSFESFLEYYSFKVGYDYITVYNCDGIPYEIYYNSDYSDIPIPVLGFGEKELENYIEQTIKMQLEEQEANKIAEKEEIKRKIELLTKQLENE